jgi:hypothetical protein
METTPEHFTDSLIFSICVNLIEALAGDLDMGWLSEERFFRHAQRELAVYGWDMDKFLSYSDGV